MPSQHQRPPLSVRLPEALETWLRKHAAETKRPVNAVITEAVTRYRARINEHAEEVEKQ
jgi:predicted transcriptional regulator